LDRLCCVTDCSYIKEGRVSYVTYGNGKIRTYEKGKVDWRCDNPIKSTIMQVAAHISNSPKEAFLIPVSLAIELFNTPENEFDL
jgi:hypothetical protein